MNKTKSGGRRRSRSLVGFASKDLCETIPKSLAPSERLLMLIELSFQYALSTVRKEVLPNDFDLSIFQQKGVETWQKVRSIIEEKNLCQLAVAENGITSNSFSFENIAEYHKTVKKLETESNKWKEQVSSYRESLKRKIDSTYTIDTSIWKDKDQLYDYSDLIQSTSSIQDGLSRQVTSLRKFTTTYKNCLQHSKREKQIFLNRCHSYFKQNVPDTPRTVMRRMMQSKRFTPYSVRK